MSPAPASIARLHGPGDLRFESEALPAAPGAGEILARTLWSAISTGTELAAFQGLPPLRPGRVYPRLVGYCNAAEIVAVGVGVTGFAPGAHVLTWQSHRSAFVVPAADVLAVLPPGADARAASTAYLFHLGLDAVHRTAISLGHKVAVLGMGALGLGAVAMAARAGADVTAITARAEIAGVARAMGACDVVGPDEADAAAQATGLGGFDNVVSTSNRWVDWELALRLVRKGGTVAVLGFPGRGEPLPSANPLASQYFYDKQLRIVACGQPVERDAPPVEIRFTLKRNMADIVGRIARGDLPAGRLLTAEYPAASLADAYRALVSRRPGDVTSVLAW